MNAHDRADLRKSLEDHDYPPEDAYRDIPALLDEVERLEFINDYFYESLGPANDEIAEMAEEEWKARKVDEE